MSDARNEIFAMLRARRADRPGGAAAEVEARLRDHPRNLIPARAQLAPGGQAALFQEMAVAAAATVEAVPDLDEVPAAVARYLAEANLPARLKAAPALRDLPWDQRPALEVAYGPPVAEDLVGISLAMAGVAETGTLMLLSGPDTPSTLNFLPDIHMVVLPVGAVVGSYEDAFDRMRALGATPRTVNFITGPSRTADIEQTLFLGAHGPRRLHILLVGEA